MCISRLGLANYVHCVISGSKWTKRTVEPTSRKAASNPDLLFLSSRCFLANKLFILVEMAKLLYFRGCQEFWFLIWTPIRHEGEVLFYIYFANLLWMDILISIPDGFSSLMFLNCRLKLETLFIFKFLEYIQSMLIIYLVLAQSLLSIL